MIKKCISCHKEFSGRVDKIYCSSYCKSDYHYQKNKEKKTTLFRLIDNQLKLNYRLLKHFNQAGKSTIRSEKLLASGFNPNIFTHYWKTKSENIYLFCYDSGFLKSTEHGIEKYILIDWQPKYMTINGLC